MQIINGRTLRIGIGIGIGMYLHSINL